MDAQRLIDTLISHGADREGITDRFSGNAELYKSCFFDFLEESNFALLDNALTARDYKTAFSAAHALKGLSGNLGITDFYNAVCALVESLRSENYENVGAEYSRMLSEYVNLKNLCETADKQAAVCNEKPDEKKSAHHSDKKIIAKINETKNSKFDAFVKKLDNDKIGSVALILILVILLFVIFLFGIISAIYQKNISRESAEHLVEINSQISLYVQRQIESDWSVASSVCDNMADGNYEDDEAVSTMIKNKIDIWNVTDIILYNDDGAGLYSDGTYIKNDIASDTVARAKNLEKYITVIDSSIIYTIPSYADVYYKGSKIAAVSVVRSMDSFLDEMGLNSFNGAAWIYLTKMDGVVISKLNKTDSPALFNIHALLDEGGLQSLTNEHVSPNYIFGVTKPSTFILNKNNIENYVVATPIFANNLDLLLFFIAPEYVVNRTMNGFSNQLTFISFFIIFIFAGCAFIMLYIINKSRRVQLNRELSAREKMFDLLIENTGTAFGLLSLNLDKPLYVSSNTAAIIGEEYITFHKNSDCIYAENSEKTQNERITQLNEALKKWDGESEFKSGYIKNGERYFEINLYPVADAGEGFVGIAQDVSGIYARDKATTDALEMAEHANEVKMRFLSNMSHDIRTPMNAIVNMTAFAIESIDKPKQLMTYLQTTRESSEHLLHIINDVLDMSRIESGQTVISAVHFDLCFEMKRQSDIISSLCKVKNQTFITDFDDVTDKKLIGDPVKLSQIVSNLLSNAVKYTPEKGAVRFTVKQIPSLREDTVDVRIIVEDNGIGISKDYLTHIFEPFSREDNKHVSSIEGTGLGLSIVHNYVIAMGGTISCESEEGEGSVFTVELFFKKSTGTSEVKKSGRYSGETPFLGMRCLVGEDNEINKMIAKTLLERIGFIADIASDGEDVVQMFSKSPVGYYDVIYMDIQMPNMNGYQATEAIRSSSHEQARTVPVIAMTANIFSEDIEKARISGMDGYLGKPVVTFDLIEETQKVLNKKRMSDTI